MQNMIKNSRRAIGVLTCLIVLAAMLVLAGCGGSSPNKPGNQQPSNGYSIISLFQQEVGNLLP